MPPFVNTNCSVAEKEAITLFGSELLKQMQPFLSANPRNGMWLVSCIQHNVVCPMFNTTEEQAFTSWLEEGALGRETRTIVGWMTVERMAMAQRLVIRASSARRPTFSFNRMIRPSLILSFTHISRTRARRPQMHFLFIFVTDFWYGTIGIVLATRAKLQPISLLPLPSTLRAAVAVATYS
eukprot:SAG11_NODE_4371_length_1929_cov_3.734426_3_plen_181_part_00